MHPMTRILSSLVLALVLALTSQSMAVARGASAATGQMVLCTGTGPMAVYTDADGKPTQAPLICPDSTLHVVFEGDVAKAEIPQNLVWIDGVAPSALPVRRAVPRVCPPCRAPPLAV
tara:strand:+ start:204 stop:554 length:351 start_codon:yes stop_codon:yes gene_type:complete